MIPPCIQFNLSYNNYLCIHKPKNQIISLYALPKGQIRVRYGIVITENQTFFGTYNFDGVNVDESSLPVDSSEAKNIVAKICASFGLNTKETAQILQVERQTIYAWINGENEPNEKSSRRLRLLDKFAAEWNSLSSLPAEKYINVAFGGITLFNLLRQDKPDNESVRKTMSCAAKKIRAEQTEQKSDKRPVVRNSECDFITRRTFIPNGCQ